MLLLTSLFIYGSIQSYTKIVVIHYKSGAKTRVISKEIYKKLIKVIFYDKNVEKGLLNILNSTCPDEVVQSASSTVAKESKELCRRQSDFILHGKAYDNIMNFSWDDLYQSLLIGAPNVLRVVSAMVTDSIPSNVPCKSLQHILFSIGLAFHGRFREMTTLQYLIGLVLLHGGCTHRDIERLAKLGITVTPATLRNKLKTWQDHLDAELIKLRDEWANGSNRKYQLVGDNWDKNILPSYRTSDQKTESIHLFNVIGVIDRVTEDDAGNTREEDLVNITSLSASDFIPSPEDQVILCTELTFIVAHSVIDNFEQINNLLGADYPDHLLHKNSAYAGSKTAQHSLGLFDCDEKKTQDVIKLLKLLTDKYVPKTDGELTEEVFFGGDRLTDERIQVAQMSMANANTPAERLEGFISKIEDFHRLMNFLEAIHKLTYSTQSGRVRGTVHYYRNLLNCRNVKGEVKNSYRPYKFLYYTIFDAICCVLFLRYFGLTNIEEDIPVPENVRNGNAAVKTDWLNSICKDIVSKFFFDDGNLFENLRNVLLNPDHEENYWVSTHINGRFKCHFCAKTYSFVDTLKAHEEKAHGYVQKKGNTKSNTDEADDQLLNYVLAVFRLVALHKNLDTAVDMGDGHRVVRSAKYETPIYNKTNKVKYLIGSIHLTGMVSGTLPYQQTERLIANRFINITGGKNNNMALDEYVEMLNRDTKNTCSGFQTKESIIQHSKEFPHLIDAVKHYDLICEVRGRKGFHRIPSYRSDVKKVADDLISISAFSEQPGRDIGCQTLVQNKNPYHDSYKQLPTMIFRHKPVLPFRRLKNKHY